ncbi:glutathione S-transferase family protein [Pseudochelatococcus sp. B33]
MATILYSRASPYGAKARMAARFAEYEAQAVLVDTFNPEPDFLKRNPLGKIPVLTSDDGRDIYDSRVITQFLDGHSGGKLFPRDDAERLAALHLESLADGISDCLQAIMSEHRFRPDEKKHAPWIDWLWSKVERSLDVLAGEPPAFERGLHAGHIALRAMLGYLAVRFAGQWEKGREDLAAWAKNFDAAYPQLAELLPQTPVVTPSALSEA